MDEKPDATNTGGGEASRGISLAPGSLLAHTYEIVGKLASGGMGEVYRARHRFMKTEHAIKIILPELASDQRVVGLFQREAQVLRQLRHEAVVAYDGLFSDEHGRVYLAMEFVDGPSLKDALKNGAIPPDEVRMLRDRLASGLAAAHEVGVVHRDLSPDNVILPGSRLDHAKIIDFGIAKRTDPEKSTIIGSQFAGKYSYASPEQFGMYGGDVGPKSDIYSLGLILAAAASGRSLPMGTSTIEVVQARQRVPDLKGVPAELRGEIAPMLAPDPKDRPASMHELVPRGRTAKSKPPAGKRTQPPAKKTARPKKPGAAARAAVLTLVGLLALGAAGGGGWWYWQQSQSSGNGNGQQAVLAAMTGVFNEQDCARLNGEVSDDGTLTVSGRIGSAQARDALIDRLAAIDGVERVEPFLAIRPCDQPQPPFDRQAVRVALDRTFAAYACSDLSASLADDGTVRLAGEIGSGEDLASLRQQVRAIEGVRRVEDTLSIVPCPGEDRLPDLRAAVDRALGDFAGDACADLSAELAEGGRVRLFGHVGSREEFQAAQDRVAGIDGVTAVDNAVAVRPCEQPEEAPEEPARPDRQTVMAAVNRAVQAVECGEVSAQLDQDRTVRLTGTIGDQSAERALRSAVGRIDGVSGVTADFRYRPCRSTDVEPAALAGRVAEIAEGVRCAGISTDVTDDRHVVLSGYVGSERDRRRLESRLLALDDVVAVDGALAVYPWPLCEAIGLARLGEAGRAAGLEIAASNPDGVYSAGELLALEIDAPDFDGFVYVDYFDNQGNVVHMLPAPARPDNAVRSGERITIGDADDGGNPYPIPAANGPHLVLVVAAPSKLFALDRSQVEDARGYLRDLRSAIRRVNNGDGPDAVVGYQILTLQPS